MALLRWAPVVILVVGAVGVLLGAVAMGHDAAEVRLMGASLVLGVVVLSLLALDRHAVGPGGGLPLGSTARARRDDGRATARP